MNDPEITVENIDGKEVKLPTYHAYSIKNVDGNTVTIVNLWDSSEEIVLSKKTFLNTFSDMDYVDLSGGNNFEKWGEEQDLLINYFKEKLTENELENNKNITLEQYLTEPGK